MCGRRLGTGSCVSVRQTTNLVVRGLGRAFLCLSVSGYAVHAPASCVPDVPRTVGPQVTTRSGLMYRDISVPEGGRGPNTGDTVWVHYTGRLEDGTVFDSSVPLGEPG